MEAPTLTHRQAQILKLIVREHVKSAIPVASRTLVESYQLDVSSATVRNEMAQLEELGYLLQPHTSAGRIPTENGFRYFVERLMEEQTLSPVEQRRIAHQFHQARNHIEEWMPLAASVVARTTRSAAVVTAPRAERAIYKHLELISTHGRAVLLVLVLEGGTVEQRFLALSTPLSQPSLSELTAHLNERYTGLTVGEIKRRPRDLSDLEQEVTDVVLSLMQKSEKTLVDEIYHHGLPDLLKEPEFAEEETKSAGLIEVLEEHNHLRAVIADALSPSAGIGNVRVIIGGESRWDALRACSMVLTRYGIADYATGALGVLGPIRMSYGRTISVVRFVADVLNEMVYEMYNPENQEEGLPPVKSTS